MTNILQIGGQPPADVSPVPPAPPAPPATPSQPATPVSPEAPLTIEPGPGDNWVINDRTVQKFEFDGRNLRFTFEEGSPRVIPVRDVIPDGVVDLFQSFVFLVVMLVVGRPIARAIARRIDRNTASPRVPEKVMQQLTGMEQSLDHLALEIERISEAQRFNARVLASEAHEQDLVRTGAST